MPNTLLWARDTVVRSRSSWSFHLGHGGEPTHKTQGNFWQWKALKEPKQEMRLSNWGLRWGGLLWHGGQEEHFKKYVGAKPWMMRRSQSSKDKGKEGIPGRGKSHCKVQKWEWAQHVNHACPFPETFLHGVRRSGIYSSYKYRQMLEPMLPGFISRLWPWESHPTSLHPNFPVFKLGKTIANMKLVRREDTFHSSCHIISSQWGKLLDMMIMNPSLKCTQPSNSSWK